MTRRWPGAVLAAVALCGLSGWDPLRAADPLVERGNRAYRDQRWDDAVRAYQAARDDAPSDVVDYNLGTTWLRRAQAEPDPEAAAQLRARGMAALERAAGSRRGDVQSRAHYNRGNALLGEGKLDEAIAAYRSSLRADPTLEDARINLELAMRRRQQQQPPRQGQGQGQGQGQPGQGQPGQDPSQGQGQGRQGQDQSPGQAPPPAQPGHGPSPGQGQPSPQPQPGQDQPQGQPDPSDAPPPPPGARAGRNSSATQLPGDVDAALGDLERESRALRRRRAAQRSGRWSNGIDW